MIEYKQFDIQRTVQSIWGERDLETKKSRLIEEVVGQFAFKEKQVKFTQAIQRSRTHGEVDRILSNIVLQGEGLSSVK